MRWSMCTVTIAALSVTGAASPLSKNGAREAPVTDFMKSRRLTK
jgi:hypothetical protein